MKRFYIFTLAAMIFAACTTDNTQNLQLVDNPETLTVGFEGGDDHTRIQLNETGQTVWTENDLVSVFYRSNANQQWKFRGNTGDRTGVIERVTNEEGSQELSNIVVVYPYSEDYYINPQTSNVQASLPSIQSYLKDSYGLNGNIMISSSEYKQFTLKSVCGWIKLQLTGNGEQVQSITLKGNNEEQVAGEIYINSADATSVLASAEGVFGDDSEVGGTMVEGELPTVVTLDCGEGVALGKEPTAFYIALPPQTFEKGVTVEITTIDGKTMVQSTYKQIAIERNAIQPMTSFVFEEKIAANQIKYTSKDGNIVEPYATDVFGANIVSNLYNAEDGCWTITFDGDVIEIGEKAFYGYNTDCNNITSITIPDSVTAIGKHAFAECTSLSDVTIGSGVASIGDYGFYNCTSLTSVTIPESVTSIANYAFSGCTSLQSFYGKFASMDNRCLIMDGVLHSFAIGCGATEYTTPHGVTSIGAGAFSKSPSLTSVTISEGVTTIGESAFRGCSSLRNVAIPESVAYIVSHAFYECTSLVSVTIPEAVPSIRVNTFGGCTSLEAFYGKFASKDNRCLIIDGELNSFAPAGLASYTIPDNVTSIGQNAFAGYSSLTSVTIPSSVTSIKNGAFSGCTSIVSVTIPESVAKINYNAFSKCTSLKEVYCKPTTPPTGGSDMFYKNAPDRKIYVPASDDDSIINAYKAQRYWSNYASYIEEYNF